MSSSFLLNLSDAQQDDRYLNSAESEKSFHLKQSQFHNRQDAELNEIFHVFPRRESQWATITQFPVLPDASSYKNIFVAMMNEIRKVKYKKKRDEW